MIEDKAQISDIKYRISSIKYLISGVGILCLDQLTKYLVHHSSDAFKSFLRPGFFLEAGKNAHGPFSWPISNYVLLVGGAILIAVILQRFPRNHTAIAVIVAAGASNLLDRLFFGSVREVARIGTLTFNLADIAIVLGSASILLSLLLSKNTPQTLPTR